MTLPTFTDGVLTNAAAMNALSTSVNALSTATLGANPPRTVVSQVKLLVASQSVTNSVFALISWGSALSNTDTMWTSGTPAQVTIQTPGTYVVAVELVWAPNASGDRTVWGMLNGTSPASNSVCINEQPGYSFTRSAIGTTHHMSTVLPNLVAGNTFFVGVKHNITGGGNLSTMSAGFTASASSLSMWRVGP